MLDLFEHTSGIAIQRLGRTDDSQSIDEGQPKFNIAKGHHE